MKIPKARKLASGSWNICLRLGGESISITAPTEKACTIKASRIKTEYLAGDLSAVYASSPLLELAERYLNEREGILSPSTVRGYRCIIQRYAHLHRRPADSIRWQQEASLAARRWSAKTVHNDFGFWASVIKAAGLHMPTLRLPQIVPEEHPWLTPEEIPIFLEAIRGKSKEIGALLALHGLRRSELLALEKGSIWGGTIYVRGAIVPGEDGLVAKKENKNAASRRSVPVLIPRLQQLVDAAPDGKLYPFKANSLYDFVNSSCKKVGLQSVGVHGLRHSFASLCYHAGLSERQTMELGGWSDPSTMRRIYTHLSTSDRDAGADKLRAFFSADLQTCKKNANET